MKRKKKNTHKNCKMQINFENESNYHEKKKT